MSSMSGWPDGDDPGPALVSIVTDGFCYGPLVDRLSTAELAGSGSAQRWSDAGAPTIYLASDAGVALAEWGRHVPLDERRQPSALWRVPVRLDRAVDLRRIEPAQLVRWCGAGDPAPPSLGDGPWYLDADRTRDLAAVLRYVGRADGLIVPSVAFLDDHARGNLVVFVDDDPSAEHRLGEPTCIAEVHWTDDRPVAAPLDTRVQPRTDLPDARL
jgi:RES domain-containing protein